MRQYSDGLKVSTNEGLKLAPTCGGRGDWFYEKIEVTGSGEFEFLKDTSATDRICLARNSIPSTLLKVSTSGRGTDAAARGTVRAYGVVRRSAPVRGAGDRNWSHTAGRS